MVMDALRGYVQLASGLTEVTRQRAQQAAKQLLQQTGADSLTSGLTGKVGDLADEIVATSKSNRALLQAIIANEVEGAVAKLGFVRVEEVAALRRRIDKLEQEKAAAAASTPTETPTAVPASVAGVSGGSTAKKTPAKKTPAKKASKKAASEKTASEAIKTVAAATPAKTTASNTPKTTPSTPLKSASKPAAKSAAPKTAKKTAKKSAKKA